MREMNVPFFRPSITAADIKEVTECLASGWLTTGPRVKAFEEAFANYVGARHAIAVNSCTAALHLALEAVGIQRGDLVLVPAMTFAATAEVVRYFDAVPVFVDCTRDTLCLDVAEAARTAEAIRAARPVAGLNPPYGPLRAVIPMHYGGQMVNVDAVRRMADKYELAVVEDAAHTLPADYRTDAHSPWRRVGTTGDITCFSFYANKCITTGEGGMAVTDSADLADRMRVMSLHGMNKDAWKRFTAQGSWYYEIVAPGFKYNMTDLAGAIGLTQLQRAGEFLKGRQRVAEWYLRELSGTTELQLPQELSDRRHSWHLFPIFLQLDRLRIDRASFIDELKARGVTTSVHWMPLPLQPYYVKTYGFQPGTFPIAESLWPQLVSLPVFPTMTEAECAHVVAAVREICTEQRRA